MRYSNLKLPTSPLEVERERDGSPISGPVRQESNGVAFTFTKQGMVVRILCCLMLLLFFHPCCDGENKVKLEAIQKWLTTNNDTDPTYNQIKTWFDNLNRSKLVFDGYPRLFSFCVTPDQIDEHIDEKDKLYKFKEILQKIKDEDLAFYHFDLQSDYATNSANGWNLTLELSRINSPAADMVNMRQWMHIKVTAESNLKGLLIQSIGGPMGLPFGEFSVEFPCKDSDASKREYKSKISETAYCAYRPRSDYQHPTVYVAVTDQPQKEFHVHYSWSDITCMESPYLQMIAVKEFTQYPIWNEHFKPLLSPVYTNFGFDSTDGGTYPYVHGWVDEMNCYFYNNTDFSVGRNISKKPTADNVFAPITWIPSEEVFRIQPNEHFDLCTQKRTKNETLLPDDRFRCPPGPFRCNAISSSLKEPSTDPNEEVFEGTVDKALSKRTEMAGAENVTSESACDLCFAPRCSMIFPNDPAKCQDITDISPFNATDEDFMEALQTKGDTKSHGIWSMLSFLVLIPFANFMARFYKEVCGDFLCGNGPWLLVHIGSHIGSLVVMWMSIGPVLPALGDYQAVLQQCAILHADDAIKAGECAKEKSFNDPHNALGVVAFLLLHCVLLFGFSRLTNNFFRFIQVALHSHFGYLTFVFGAAAGITGASKSPCTEVIVWTSLLVVVPIIFTGVGVALDCMTDKRMGIKPSRKQWPILEPIKIEGKGPYNMVKWAVLGSLGFFMMLLWIFTLASYQLTSGVPDFLQKGDSESNITNIKDVVPKGMFGECK